MELSSIPTSAVSVRFPRPSEVTAVHTRMIRVALAVEESRSYWEHVDPRLPRASRTNIAFEQRWFGNKSLHRVRFLLSAFAERFDAYPEALAVLRRWRTMDIPTRQLVCHWHLQLSDPLYRGFSGELLVERRGLREPTVDRDVVLRWLRKAVPNRWADATLIQVASKLLAGAAEAGLVTPKRDPRSFLFPKVTDQALTYLLYLLRGTDFAGTLISSPYLASVGLEGGLLDQRLRALNGLTFRRMGQLTEFEWSAPSLLDWAEASL